MADDKKEFQDKLPTSKVQRAGRVFKTTFKVGANYIKHAAQKVVNDQIDEQALNEKNADELFKLMSQLKGSALKIAQMISMDNGFLPKQYAEKFAQAQNSAMALSAPLVVNTFKKYIGKTPQEIFDKFNPVAVHSASIGQVHKAEKDGLQFAVKLQYPGVAESIHSDINLVKPIFLRVIGVKEKEVQPYFDEFEERLNEECDYEKELHNAVFIAEKVKHIPNLIIPKYYPEYSSKKILTMQWMNGMPLQQFLEQETNQDKKNKVGQALLDFLFYQIHYLHQFHADPHPGNFLVSEDAQLIVLDFGCVKSISIEFYQNYFALANEKYVQDKNKLNQILSHLDVLRPNDNPEKYTLFLETAKKAIALITYPTKFESFYFGDKNFYEKLQAQGEEIFLNKEFRKPDAIRGSQHAIYLHRAFYGMYAILYKLNATVKVDSSFIEKIAI